MAAVNSPSTLNGLYKRVYGELKNAVPKMGWGLKNIPWDRQNKIGDRYEIDVILANENGVTYGGSGGTGFTLVDSVAMSTQPAFVTSFEYVIRSQMSYGAATRARNKGKAAFANAMSLIMENGAQSLADRNEISLWHGQTGIGVVAAGGIVDGTATTFTFVFSEAEWAAGIWQGKEGAGLQVYDEGDALEESSSVSLFTVTSINYATRSVLVTSTAGLITQVETKNDTEALTVYFNGSRTNDMLGMRTIFSNTTGTVHGIDAGDFGAWAGNPFSCGSEPLTHAKIMGFAAQLQNRGNEDEDMNVVVNPFTWADLHQEQAAARVYDESYEKAAAEQGFKAIRYYCPSGWIKIVASPVVKGGEGFMFPLSVMKRIGSAEKEWEIPGAHEDPWHPVPNTAAAEIRMYTDQTVFCELPSRCAYISAISNNFGVAG
jgi:hypothetical protein